MLTVILVAIALFPIVLAAYFALGCLYRVLRSSKPVWSPIDNDDAVSHYNKPLGFFRVCRYRPSKD